MSSNDTAVKQTKKKPNLAAAHGIEQNLLRLIRAFFNRSPSYSVASTILKQNSIRKSIGEESSTKRMIEYAGQSPENLQKVKSLDTAVMGFIMGAEKVVTLFDVSVAGRKAILMSILADSEEQLCNDCSFPLELNEAELLELDDQTRLVHRKDGPNGITAIYGTKRKYTIVKKGLIDELPAAVLDSLRNSVDGISDVYGVVEASRVFYDIIHVPKSGKYIELRMDTGGSIPSRTLSKNREIFVRSLEDRYEVKDRLKKPVNLFPLVDEMYSDPKEGFVTELKFDCMTGGVRDEKLKRNQKDLRLELYHAAGKDAVAGDIYPYRLSVGWKVPISGSIPSFPELYLPGSQKMLEDDRKTLTSFRVHNAYCLKDYEFVVSKVQKRINS